jgi:peptidyl-prolyl cis-trans isomerase C
MAVAGASCERHKTAAVDFRRAPVVGVTGGIWVAKFGDEKLTDAELNVRFAEMNPYARARYQTAQARREYIEGLIRFELLSQEAVAQNLHNHPEVVEAAKRVMVQLLLKQELEDKVAPVSLGAVTQYYELHKADYVKPAMTRLSHVFFRVEHRAQAVAAFETAKTFAPLDYAAFGKLARELSDDDTSKELDGDLRFLSDEEITNTWGESLLLAVRTLQRVGDVAPALVEGKTGLHILKLTGRQLALNLSLEQAKPSIEQVLSNESKQERMRALLEQLNVKNHVEFNDEAINKMVIDTKAPTVDSKTPAPGFIPAPLSDK